MVFIKGGAFNREYTFEESVMFGLSKTTKKGIQKITLNDFSIGKYPITQAQWRAVMGNNPSHFKGNDNCPVETVSWEDCHEFINNLNKKTGKKYRLPTETEWEFAARGGDKSKDNEYSGSNNIDEVAWFIGNSEGKTHPIGTKKANELGIYDMSGNVWEWCSDLNGSYDNRAVSKSKSGVQDSPHVMRGGSWHSDARRCRVAVRSAPTERNNRLGFRVVLSS